jgi:hypothetical protein
MLENLDKTTKLISLDKSERMKAQIIGETRQYQVTDVRLELKAADSEFSDYVYVTIYEGEDGKKRIAINGAYDMSAWTDIMGYIKAHL